MIPTLRAGRLLPGLLDALRQQTLPPRGVLVIDSSSDDDTVAIAERGGCRVHVIPRAAFNHGTTRNLALQQSAADILVFMTQDARPVDQSFLDRLTARLRSGEVAASYARQVPYPGAPPTEVFTRHYNYPEQEQVRRLTDPDDRGYRRYFFSNVAAAVQRQALADAGGFPHCITFEDMALCAKLLHSGHAVAYEAQAQVYHSHDYRLDQHFRRYFDAGVFFAGASDLLRGASTGGQGFAMLRRQLAWLWRERHRGWIVRALAEAVCKVSAFQLGKRHGLLPKGLVRRCSASPTYWDGASG